jgi:homoserine O-acetyltransferase/O-succinyltransferase
MIKLYEATKDFQKYQLPYDLHLVSGKILQKPCVAYETYGTLNADKSNAILVCHGFTGDQFCASKHPLTNKEGYWQGLIGAGKAIDTDKYYVISTNVIGGAMGSTSPCTLNPVTGKFYGTDFPLITITDMMNAQLGLLDYLGIDTLLCAIGGSMGGMQVLELARLASHRVKSVIPIACSWRYSAQNIAFHEIGRRSIMSDPDWLSGDYLNHNISPTRGLSLARMVAHITYMSEQSLQQKFGRNLQTQESFSYNLEADFQIESYLHHQGSSFVERFDANCYLYLTRALDYFDLTQNSSQYNDTCHHNYKNCLADIFADTKTKFCFIAFTTDWLFPPSESKDMVRALNAVGGEVSYVVIDSDKGHDSFLLDDPEMLGAVKGFLNGIAKFEGVI